MSDFSSNQSLQKDIDLILAALNSSPEVINERSRDEQELLLSEQELNISDDDMQAITTVILFSASLAFRAYSLLAHRSGLPTPPGFSADALSTLFETLRQSVIQNVVDELAAEQKPASRKKRQRRLELAYSVPQDLQDLADRLSVDEPRLATHREQS